jgi:hypothetical protein
MVDGFVRRSPDALIWPTACEAVEDEGLAMAAHRRRANPIKGNTELLSNENLAVSDSTVVQTAARSIISPSDGPHYLEYED